MFLDSAYLAGLWRQANHWFLLTYFNILLEECEGHRHIPGFYMCVFYVTIGFGEYPPFICNERNGF
jgi:hypothetical protein